MSNLPPSPPPPSSPSPVDPASAVKGPAMFLMIVGGLIILAQILGLVLNLLGVGLGAMNGREGVGSMLGGGVGMALNVLNIILAVVVVLGAMKMSKLQSYGMAMAAAVIAMLPCSFCCLIGLPAGIWALIVLMKPEVKAAFNQGAAGV